MSLSWKTRNSLIKICGCKVSRQDRLAKKSNINNNNVLEAQSKRLTQNLLKFIKSIKLIRKLRLNLTLQRKKQQPLSRNRN